MNSFDPEKVIVVLLGSAELWISCFGRGEPANPFILPERENTLQLRRVRVAQITTFMKTLQYSDKLGHLSNGAREIIVPELMRVFEMLALPLSWVAGRVAGRSLGDCKIEQESDAEAELGRGQRMGRGGKMAAEYDGGGGSRIPKTPEDDEAQGDILNAEAYLGWEDDLLAQHGVLSPKLKSERRGMPVDKFYFCEQCQVPLASWCQVAPHVKGKRHT